MDADGKVHALSKYLVIDLYAKAIQGMAAQDAVTWAEGEQQGLRPICAHRQKRRARSEQGGCAGEGCSNNAPASVRRLVLDQPPEGNP